MARQLASIKKIQEIRPINGADAICQYRIDGWWIVDRINQYSIGDLVVYCEIDSFIPNSLAPFLSKGKEPREYNGVKGERLRTVRLRGALSQGLILPLSILPDEFEPEENFDITEILGIQKWEPPIPAQLAGLIRGNFPSEIVKTDQTRIQSLVKEFEKWKLDNDHTWEVTEKMDGSSMTVAYVNGEIHVCSRNLSLKEDEDNSFWKVAKNQDLIDIVKNHYESTSESIALQGELCGPGIQGNSYKLNDHKFFLFDIWSIDRQQYLSPVERQKLVDEYEINHVPILYQNHVLPGNMTIDELLQMAEGKTIIGSNSAEREGLVFKRNREKPESFKVISNKFLIHNNG